MIRRLLVLIWLAVFLAGGLAFAAPSTGQEALSKEDVARLRAALSLHERYLDRVNRLIGDLERAADHTNNASRRSAIDGLHGTMAQVILQVEEEIGRENVIQQHGKQPMTTEERQAKGDAHTHVHEKMAFSQAHRTGGTTPGKYWIHRLAQMQSIYRVCATAREPAISKHERGLPAFIDKAQEFALLMERNISDVRDLLPEEAEATKEEDGKRTPRKSKYE